MAQKELSVQAKKIDYEKVQNSQQFNEFLRKKFKFTIPLVIFFMIYYFLLPIFTSYTTFLNTSAIGDISWTWLFAISQFIMVWTLSGIYVRKATSFDKEAEQIISDQLK